MSESRTYSVEECLGIEAEELAERITEAIDRPRKGNPDKYLTDNGGGWLPKADLPGFGEAYDDCGEDRTHFCGGCGAQFDVGRTCGRSTCPRCAQAWVVKRAGTSREAGEPVPGLVAQLQKTAKMMSSDLDNQPVFKHHAAFMPPMHDWFLDADDPLDRTFQVIKEIMDEIGVEGVVFYHPWAGDNEDQDHDDRGEWKHRLFAGRDFESDVRGELIPRGHFHVVCVGPFFPTKRVFDRVHEATGWVTKRFHQRGSNRSLSELEDVARAVTYCLSHTGIDTSGDQNKALYRKFGSTYHDGKVSETDRREADAAVRKVAPRTLGIPARSLTCHEEIPEELALTVDQSAEPTPTEADGDGSGDGAGDGDDLEPEGTTDVGAVERVPCEGKVWHIREAEAFLSDEEWFERAPFAPSLQTTWEQWKDGPPD